ncbi:uncharacterized protein TNCT_477381 [Trichonephila clavata]|uniref:Uncharacterized protein n=1 Tax=Trichonephila clavata TaxID=2740835 RepID=A0A8X6M4J1_TRICU|nr:uncharacterized protein TNCT_477381 [Trichonephila clavata]
MKVVFRAIDDSLNCTSDIIDEDCDKEDGRDRFDSWLRALRGTYSYVCEGSGHNRLRKLLRSIPCWSLEDFIFCCEEQLGLTHIQNLLYTEFSEFECRKLRLATKQCHKEAFVDSCREQEDVETEVKKMISSFFSASRCHGVGLDAGSSEAAKFSFSEFITIFTLSAIALLLG